MPIQILSCFKLSLDEFTLLCECLGGKSMDCILVERTMLYSLRDRLFIDEKKGNWILSPLGEFTCEAVALLRGRAPRTVPADIVHIR